MIYRGNPIQYLGNLPLNTFIDKTIRRINGLASSGRSCYAINLFLVCQPKVFHVYPITVVLESSEKKTDYLWLSFNLK